MTFRIFAAAVSVALLHAFDDAFLLPGGGVPLTQHALAFAIALGASALAVWRFRSFRPGVQAALAFTFGALAMVNGGRHAHHVLNEGWSANDVTGVLALVAGVVLVGLAAWIPFAHRGEGSWPARLLVPPLLVLSVVFLFGPVGMAIVDIHSLHRPVGSPPNAAYKTVHFTASDGVRLEGWHRPSRNGASVLMISGGGGNRRSTLRHATMLERHGYGVLVYDPRGSGNSEGTVNSYGWGWDKDADAAMDYLAAHGGGRIGALGLSTGADMAIDAAGRRSDVAAVVADGSAAIGYEDIKEYTRRHARPCADVGPVQGHRGHPGPLGPRGLARRPDRAHAHAEPADLGQQGGEAVGRALRPARRLAEHALVPAARGPHRGAAPVSGGVRAARHRLPRRPLANLK